ncbi:LCCL domain-containing protein [Roseococcus sp.]|uniref:LCCL domain-containing protein n=1 Tax=Roseococcus sp. TaxID=2109646 RepID=UPI003BABCAF7
MMRRLLLLSLLLPLALLGWTGAAGAQSLPNCPPTVDGASLGRAEMSCRCPAEALSQDGSVWGTDTYTADSAVCLAARHAGAVTAKGGDVRLRITAGLPGYRGSARNGVETRDYGSYPQSIAFAQDSSAATEVGRCPNTMASYAGSSEVLSCACPSGGVGSVWGSDTYTADSDVCRAALHAGVAGRSGGTVRIRMLPGEARYAGSTRNGLTTSNYGPYAASYRFEGETVTGAQGAAPAGSGACPDNMSAYDGSAEVLRCACSPQAMAAGGTVWGSDAYTADSATCRAALHAGALRGPGGQVSIRMLGGLPRYVGTTRNGVQSQNYQNYGASFRFEGMEASGPQLCPDNMSAFAGTTETLRCICTGEAVLRTSAVWGTNAYTADSGTCRAARHAGVVPVTGGLVELKMQPGDPRYPGSTSNGVTTINYGEYPAGFRFLGGQNVAVGAPMQAPVAAALRQQGRVSLYITFRTNSADLDISAAPVLTQVREAMAADPAMRLRLVGHTDNQGGANINVPLSQRRAASVQAWLVQNGVPAARLAADGRGQNEPIADNASEAGRSLNRRVEAVRVD